MDLVETIYKLTQTFPDAEKMWLIEEQAVSPSNITEGQHDRR
jgi:hypothetical protein